MRVGRYLLFDVIGGGGMAKVHIGRVLGAAGFSRTVAIKRLHPERARDPRFTTMLVDEARLVSRIRHTNVVPTLDVVAAGAELLLVMEYVPGVAISQLVSLAAGRSERIPLPIAARLVLDVLAGLGAAHAATSERGRALGIVHRDVSPQNVIAGTDGVARVVDFGIAKAEGKLSITREGEIKGKLAYMAPEQLRGEEVDLRADLYSTGVMLWELVTGRRLFQPNADLEESIRKILSSDIPSARQYADISPALETVLLRALAAEPRDRYESAAAMADALEAAVDVAKTKDVAEVIVRLGGASLEQRDALLADVEQLSAIHEVGAERELTEETRAAFAPPAPTERLPIVTQRYVASVSDAPPPPAPAPQITQAFVGAPPPAPFTQPLPAQGIEPSQGSSPSLPSSPGSSPSLSPSPSRRGQGGRFGVRPRSPARLVALALASVAALGVALFFVAGPKGCNAPRGTGSVVAPADSATSGALPPEERRHIRQRRKAPPPP
jgi:serine/threonine-protein kinase